MFSFHVNGGVRVPSLYIYKCFLLWSSVPLDVLGLTLKGENVNLHIPEGWPWVAPIKHFQLSTSNFFLLLRPMSDHRAEGSLRGSVIPRISGERAWPRQYQRILDAEARAPLAPRTLLHVQLHFGSNPSRLPKFMELRLAQSPHVWSTQENPLTPCMFKRYMVVKLTR